jgi:hypothetical protein
MIWTIVSAIAAVLAAVTAFAGVIIGRLNYADSELERQNRIENRIGGLTKRVEYEESEPLTDSFEPAMLFETSHYDFEIMDILVTEKTGLDYNIKKTIWGFNGDVEVDIRPQEYSMSVKRSVIETPGDFELIEEFRFDDYNVTATVDPENSLLRLQFPHSDIDKIERTIEDLMAYFDKNLGNIPPVSYEELKNQE